MAGALVSFIVFQEPAELGSRLIQPPLPSQYARMTEQEMSQRIAAHKKALGRRLVILAHHYQRDSIVQFADFVGDSLKLSQQAAQQKEAEFVVFCGVHFMAESADILTEPSVQVILPNLSAGCSMAEMATEDQIDLLWDRLTDATDAKIVPITYVNSTAEIKAFCGRHGGACCTSSNARQVLEYALSQGEGDKAKVLFMPDQHLGRNTAYAMGFPLDSMLLYDWHQHPDVLSDQQIRDAKFILWQGHCCVHQVFTVEQCNQLRQADPAIKIIVHPECDWKIVQCADMAGSTEQIIKVINEAPDGSHWAVGTEPTLVNRLIKRHAGKKKIRLLSDAPSWCVTMARIDLPHLTWVLDELATGRVVNRVAVDAAMRDQAVVALQRMLACPGI